MELTQEEITTIGLGLASLKLDPGVNLGILDAGLRSAIKQYQFKHDREPDGYLTADVATELLALGRERGADLARAVSPRDLAEGVDPRLVRAVRHFIGTSMKYGYFGSTLYVAIPTNVQFDMALDRVKKSGGHLVVFSSQEEKDFIDDFIRGDDRFFECMEDGSECFGPVIGYYQLGSAKRSSEGWTTVTGEPVRYLNWRKDEPNDMGMNNSAGFGMYGGFSAPTNTIMDMRRFQNWGSGYIVEFPLVPVED
jgi:hypothetical protein